MKNIRIENELKLARIAAGMTQQQLADLAGVTRQTIGLIESGDYNPTIRLCLKLAQITGKSLDELFWAA
jgi:putative transcriptional regulator